MTLAPTQIPCSITADSDHVDLAVPRGMPPLQNQDMLCFSHDWTGDPLSKTHIMRILARHNRILWINSIGYRTPSVASGKDLKRAFRKLKAVATPVTEVEPNIFVLNPLAIPFYGPIGSRLNRLLLKHQVRKAMRRLSFKRPINWIFNPAAASIAGAFHEKVILYYCVDEYSAFTGVVSARLLDLESQVLKKAHLVIVSAEKLYESKSALARKTVLVRHGVDFEHFRTSLDSETIIPPELTLLPKPVIGYFGLLAEDWVDVDLLVHVAKSFPRASLVLLGKSTMDLSRLQALPNVHRLGRKPYSSLPAYCKAFDVAIIPFPINEATLNSNPLKAREYLAAGLPVISTDIPEVRTLGSCRIASDAASFVQHIQEALANPGPDRARSEALRTESWESRVREISAQLTSLPEWLATTSP